MESQRIRKKESPLPQRKRAFWIGILTALVVVALAPVVSQGLLQDNVQDNAQSSQPPPELNPAPPSTQPDSMSAQQTQKQGIEAADGAHKMKIADDTARLLQLATDLKAEVDKTTKDTLSLSVIRKADAIEKLAHDARVNIKPAVGPS